MTPRFASRLKRTNTLAAHFCAFAFTLSFANVAFGAIKIIAVDGASSTENVNSADTETPVIFGGVTGVSGASATTTGAVCSGTGLCNTCSTATATINAGAPTPCNTQAITQTTRLTIQFTAAKAGFPILMNEEKTTMIAVGTTSVAVGSTAEIIVEWQDICSEMDDVDTSCNPTATNEVGTDTLFIGVTKDDDNTLDDADDESSQVTFTVSDSMSVAGYDLAPVSCATAGASDIAICDYAIQSGDGKAVLTNLGKTGNFPAIEGINISAMRVFFEQCGWGPGAVLAGFDTIAPASNFVDLAITTDESGVPELEENEITGLANGLTYCTKIGHVDQARNVGLFTPDTGDENCPVSYLKDSATTFFANSCHIARPDEVLGVLAESCFIATAAYGSPWEAKVKTFREFRNQFLLSNKVGRQIVKFYYENSKVFAKKIAKSNTARAITRGALSPIWLFARVSLKIGLLATTLLTFALFASPFAYLVYRRKQKAAL